MKLLLAGFLIVIPAAFAQSADPAGAQAKHEAEMFYMRVPGPGPAEHTFDFVSSGFSFDGNVVKNAPYSAEAVTETTQKLADGNRISTKVTANLHRDSQGRTRVDRLRNHRPAAHRQVLEAGPRHHGIVD